MKTILVTTDLSEDSRLAFGAAKQLAKAFGAKILLLAIVEDLAQAATIYSLDLPVYPDPEIQKQVLEKVNSDLGDFAVKYFSDVNCEYFAQEAKQPIHREILDFSRHKGADIIVIASHGRTGLAHILIGSVTEKVLRESHCPVLTVPIRKQS